VHQATDEDPDAGKNVLYGMSKHAHQPGESMIKKPVVLLVDDSDDFREFMNEVLTDYTVVEAVNGQDAWNKIIDRRPDIILSDVMMPVMDGNELCRMCKDNDETTAIPFIMLSARMGDEQRKESLKCGADEYIAKPFDIDMLNLCILNLLKKRKNVSTEYVITEADRKFIDEVNAYIRDNMSNPETSVESLSTHLSISRVQLYKRMISLTGITPSEYLRTKRIKFAEHLLRSGDLNISEIAYKVGFNNPRYFTKYFQDAYGVTPSQYRKNLSESE
jgi:YesN/AraC family two-component response regulator